MSRPPSEIGRRAPRRWQGRLDEDESPPEVTPSDGPPESTAAREREWVADHDTSTRDRTPAVGTHGEPASWKRARENARVGLARPGFADTRWSFLFKARDSSYAELEPEPGALARANQRMRSAPVPEVQGPFIKPPVWTLEVPLYLWVGGVASGAGFVALACDIAGDHRSAAVARKVALAAVAPAPLLLIADLGRPDRFLNMLRIFKPRSPMNMGAWCLVTFSGTIAGAVGADQLDRPRAARALGGLTSVLGGYLGSYTGVLLASTAVPLWARGRLVLGPIFVATATATGAAATRLALERTGLPRPHPTRDALGTLETAAILTELSLSEINERRLGAAAQSMHRGPAGTLFRLAKGSVAAGLSTRLIARRTGPRVHDVASVLYLLGGLAFRFAWVYAGKASATHQEGVAAMGRGRLTLDDKIDRPRGARSTSSSRRPVPMPGIRRAWAEAVRRTSLGVERMLRR